MKVVPKLVICTHDSSQFDMPLFKAYSPEFIENISEVENYALQLDSTVIIIDIDDCIDTLENAAVRVRNVRKGNPYDDIIVCSSATNVSKAILLAECGARYIIKKPFDEKEVEFVLKSIETYKQSMSKDQRLFNNIHTLASKLESWGYIDVLTQCYNHRYFSRRLSEEFNRSIRTKECLSEVIFDIDAFSSINDVYGLEVGDIVICQFADVLRDSIRSHDVLCRTGGQEFSVLLVDTDSSQAEDFANRIIETVETTVFGTEKEYLRISISAGISTCPTDKVRTSADLIRTAKAALKEAKHLDHSMSVVFDPGAEIQHTMSDPEAMRHKITDLNYQLSQGLIDMIYGFASVIEAKDAYTGQHVESTQMIAEKLAIELRLDPMQIENVRHAAILHDLGKVGIDDRILRKEGKLTDEEFEEIKKHPVIAAEILKSVHALNSALPAILYHHERYDGSGYPQNLKGNDIPLEARIISIADVYQALTSDRPYRKAFSKEKAVSIIKEESGRQFDPVIVNAFLKVIGD